MHLDKILKRIMKCEGKTQIVLARECGWLHASDVSNKISAGEEMKVKSLLRLLEGLNCELIIRAGHYDYVVGHHPKEDIVWEVEPDEIKDDVMDAVVEVAKEVGCKHNIPVYEYGRKK